MHLIASQGGWINCEMLTFNNRLHLVFFFSVTRIVANNSSDKC